MSRDSTATFTAVRAHIIDGRTTVRVERLTLEDLDDAELVVRVSYSGVGYRDAMAGMGMGKNVRTDRPCVLGVDLAGIVESSSDSRFAPGDKVIATSYGLGASHDGGFSEYARVPADWVVPLPAGLSLRHSMILGGPGLTAALAVERLEAAGLLPSSGPVVVSGASGGIGSIAIDILSHRGYEVVAVTGKAGAESYLRELGAASVVARASMLSRTGALGRERWAGAIDTAGGELLDTIARETKSHGRIAICGMTMSDKLSTSMFPFILRAVDFLGINVGRAFSMADRIRVWGRLAGDLRPRKLDTVARCITLPDVPSSFHALTSSEVMGRVLVEIAPREQAG